MTADKRPPVAELKVVLDKERTMRLDFFAAREFKLLTKAEGFGPPDEYGRPKGISLLGGGLAGLELDEEVTPLLIAACLRHEDREVDADLVARSMTVENMEPLAEALQQLLREFFPNVEVELREGEGESTEVSPEEGPP